MKKSTKMLYTNDLYGEVKCINDEATCIIDGEDTRQILYVSGTGVGKLTLRATTFKDGYISSNGGGIYIYGGTMDINLCVFSGCRSTYTWSGGGGAIYVSSATVDIYGTSFTGNTAYSGYGDDIFVSSGTITVHDTCPSPYSSNSPTQGKLR